MKSNITFLLAILIIVSFTMSGCGLLSKKYEKRDTVEFKLSTSGKTKVTLENMNGKISVAKGDTTPILIVKAVKIDRVRKKDLDKPLDYIKIELDTAGSTINISSDYERHKSFINFSFNGVKINYELIVPQNMEVSLDNTNGDVDVIGLDGPIEISVTNGDIKAEHIPGKASFDITNGSFKGGLDSTRGVTLSITNGKCELDLYKSFTGAVDAEVTNGKVTYSNLQFTNVQSEKKSFKGYIVNPDPVIKIDIVNGKVTLTGK